MNTSLLEILIKKPSILQNKIKIPALFKAWEQASVMELAAGASMV
jgi:hypothetical protein